MPTPVFLTGFEHGVAITGAAPVPDDRIWHAITTTGGTPGIDTGTPKNGARCLDIPATSAAATDVRRNISGSPTVCVASFYVRFVGSVPTADCLLFGFVPAAGSFGTLIFVASDSTLRAGLGGTPAASGFTVAANTWYLVDIRVDVSGGTRTVDLTVNGASQTQASASVAASSIASFRLGKNIATTTANVNVRYDDLVISTTTGDYPLGEHEILVMRPDSDGTHVFVANDFVRGDAGAAILSSDTDVWTLLDDITLDPPIDTTDSVQQNVIHSGSYVEIGFEAAPRATNAWGLQIHGSYDADATGADTCSLKLNDGGTISVLYTDADVSNTTVTFLTHQAATAPSSGAWTQAKLNALKARWGFSTDVTGSPILHALQLEAAYAVVAGGSSYVFSGTITGLSNITGDIPVTHTLQSIFSGQSNIISQLLVAHTLQAALSNQSSISVTDLLVAHTLLGGTVGQSVINGDLLTGGIQALAGSIAGQSIINGAVLVAHTLQGLLGTTSSISNSSLLVVHTLNAVLTGQSVINGNLRLTLGLNGSILGQSLITGAVFVVVPPAAETPAPPTTNKWLLDVIDRNMGLTKTGSNALAVILRRFNQKVNP